MNDEIKEILEYLKDKNDYIEDFGISYKRIHIDNGDLKLLLDYITNLQRENERLKELNAELKAITKRPTPIDYAMIQKRYEDYKSRCEKAIEYIQNENNITKHGIYPNYTYEVDTKDLLNILQNGSDKE